MDKVIFDNGLIMKSMVKECSEDERLRIARALLSFSTKENKRERKHFINRFDIDYLNSCADFYSIDVNVKNFLIHRDPIKPLGLLSEEEQHRIENCWSVSFQKRDIEYALQNILPGLQLQILDSNPKSQSLLRFKLEFRILFDKVKLPFVLLPVLRYNTVTIENFLFEDKNIEVRAFAFDSIESEKMMLIIPITTSLRQHKQKELQMLESQQYKPYLYKVRLKFSMVK